MKEYNKEQKDKLLTHYKWEKMTGWAMEYSAPECENVIITVEEVQKWIGKEATDYYFPEGSDYDWARDLEEAWECLCDDVYGHEDLSKDEDLENIFDKILNKVVRV